MLTLIAAAPALACVGGMADELGRTFVVIGLLGVATLAAAIALLVMGVNAAQGWLFPEHR